MSEFTASSGDDLTRVAPTPSGDALSRRTMLITILVLSFVFCLMVLLHHHVRWCVRRYLGRSRHDSRTYLVSPSRGLDASVLKSLPVFTYSDGGRCGPLECAVCLSEFEDSEQGRLLPNCGHSFHVDCIDMWFYSHSTCPLCRSPVEPVESPENLPAQASPVTDPDPSLAMSPVGVCMKPQELVGVSVEVPRRAESEDEPGCESPARQYKSPMSRMLSFGRILSRDSREEARSLAASGTAAEVDLERPEEAHQIINNN